jgi:hypothetical protein
MRHRENLMPIIKTLRSLLKQSLPNPHAAWFNALMAAVAGHPFRTDVDVVSWVFRYIGGGINSWE